MIALWKRQILVATYGVLANLTLPMVAVINFQPPLWCYFISYPLRADRTL
ncbi:hypothetical protein FRAAL0692 [Frankia alni ACN14a]|uniref:Uncharacterized protein n=1 Tax=Frankia alni (strain DSM 45986 / CECT 9034 / ACN14a) TaxID=326424 RepID=Q0RSU3_FRAAA|nr:hypothetical protein FRAAL0692 [Frankia alni ACN14a]